MLGAGRIVQRFHLPILSSMAGVKVVAVAESDATLRAACRAWAPEAVLYSDHRELLSRCDCDAAIVCLPPALHAEAGVACLERGWHLYLEKPLATRREDGERILDAWRRAGTVGRIGFNFRFHPRVVELRDAVRSGILGDLVSARFAFSSALRRLPDWKSRRASGGGALLDLGSHQFDLVRFVLGPELSAIGSMIDSRVSEHDTAACEVRLSTGQPVCVFSTLCGTEQHRIEITGTNGEIVFDRYRSSRLRLNAPERDFSRRARLGAAWRSLAGFPPRLRDVLFPPREPSFGLALGSFVAAARGEDSPGPGLDRGQDSLLTVLAAEEAARSGHTVTLPPAVVSDS